MRLYSRPGNDLTDRFRLIVEALVWLSARSCIIDGEAVCCGEDGRPSFDRIRYRRHDAEVFLYAFDLIEIGGDDLRREPLDTRKATLASLLKRAALPLIRVAVEALGARFLDGEAIAFEDDGVASFELLRGRASRSPRHRPAQAHAARRARTASTHAQRLIYASSPKL